MVTTIFEEFSTSASRPSARKTGMDRMTQRSHRLICGMQFRSDPFVHQLPAVAATLQGLTRPAGSATYITQTLRAGMVQEHAGTVVVFGYATSTWHLHLYKRSNADLFPFLSSGM